MSSSKAPAATSPSAASSAENLGARLNILLKDPWYQFKLFVLKTKVLESGVGVVIGRAFQDCVRSFVNDLLECLHYAAIKSVFERNLKHLRACPFCVSDIPVEAIRCPFCTALLDGAGSSSPAKLKSKSMDVLNKDRANRDRIGDIEDRTSEWIDTSELAV
ncbi:hypothetical protein HDU84_002233 [Entophlyctis sp. JEL0112]|nr:hypothetical protein HDU84_002233 [Entophlyctis sp. JEL0112]